MENPSTPECDAQDAYLRGGKEEIFCVDIKFARKLEIERDNALKIIEMMRKNHDEQLESDSLVASCGCLTKTNEMKYHKPGCKARLIEERNRLRDVCDEFADRIKRVRPIVREDGSTDDWIDCHIDNILKNYYTLPHVEEKIKKI